MKILNHNRSNGRHGRFNNNRHTNFFTRNTPFDSSSAAGRVRGTAQQLIDKYMSLAKDARNQDDRVMYETYLQYADHYTRLLAQAILNEQPRTASQSADAQPEAESAQVQNIEIKTSDEAQDSETLAQSDAENAAAEPSEQAGEAATPAPEKRPTRSRRLRQKIFTPQSRAKASEGKAQAKVVLEQNTTDASQSAEQAKASTLSLPNAEPQRVQVPLDAE